MLLLGQFMFKYGVTGKDMSCFEGIISVIFSPMILSALFVYACTTVLWLYILNNAPLSYVYPIQALVYPLALIVSSLMLKENVNTIQWIGSFVICIGVFLVVQSNKL